MKLDLTKPVQVDPDLSNEWVDCSFARKLNGHPEDRYAVIYSRCGGRERIGLYEARFLRNTPAPAPVEEGWRYFRHDGGQRYRVDELGEEQVLCDGGRWRESASPWSLKKHLMYKGSVETDAQGNPLATTPPRRVPYTAETWPAWAVWVRHKGWVEGVRSSLHVRMGAIVILNKNQGEHEVIEFRHLADEYEISGTDGAWRAASREVTP